ncbi:GNAT family N-acetyltransferase [Marinilabiliaceae bacterium JC017]|nr:GNAT family N-acetyltransferase [Marinilabiliaceae bacterium JC017]
MTPQVKKMILAFYYSMVRWLQLKRRGIVVVSEKKWLEEKGETYPVRMFRATTKHGKQMGSLKVMPGRYERHRYDYCVLYDLWVDTLYRHQGVGARLLMAAERFCQEEKFERLFAAIIEDNKASLALFASLDYVILKQEKLIVPHLKEVSHYPARRMKGATKELKKPVQNK